MRVRDGRGQVIEPGTGRAPGRFRPLPPGPPQETDDWVSLQRIIGTTKVPPAVANLLHDVVVRMMRAGDVTDANRWQAIEYLAADWLAGQEVQP